MAVPTQPSNLARLPVDPESLAVALSEEPSVFSYWQAQAEEHRYVLDQLKSKKEFMQAAEYLAAKGTVAEREAASKSHPDILAVVEEIQDTEHLYRQCLNEMTASDVRMTAVKKLLSWRIEESRTIAIGELPTVPKRIAGNNISFPERG